ncbi:hypothetical protein AKJ16_DCAP16713 [Drosera capensis]
MRSDDGGWSDLKGKFFGAKCSSKGLKSRTNRIMGEFPAAGMEVERGMTESAWSVLLGLARLVVRMNSDHDTI